MFWKDVEIQKISSSLPNANEQDMQENSSLEATNPVASKRGMVLPFTPLAMSFNNINYYVDMPPVNLVFYLCLSITEAKFGLYYKTY